MNNKKINKIYLKIDAIAKKGEMGRVEYYQYVNDLIDKGEYYVFQEVMMRKYKIDTIYMETYNVKKKTYDLLRPLTTSKYQEDLKKMYDSKSVYQIGINLYKNNENYIWHNNGATVSGLGTIIQSNGLNEIFVYRGDTASIFLNATSSTLLEKYASASNFLLQTTAATQSI